MPPKAIVTVQYHFDAVSQWLHNFGLWERPGKHQRGIFGCNKVPLLLDICDELDVPATWFIPGHTIDSFPELCGEVWDRGYTIECHGWTHDPETAFGSREAEKADFERAIDSIYDLTGQKPTGYGSRLWDYSKHTLSIIQELGFDWDSSLMGRDFKPYYVRDGWSAPEDGPYDPGEETDVLEIPLSWKRDDWPPLQFEWGLDNQWIANEKELFNTWFEQFDYMYDHFDHGVYNITFHPQIIGRAPRPRYHRELMEKMKERPGVEFMSMADAAKEIKANEDLWIADSIEMTP